MKLFSRKAATVEFCDRCGSVCHAGCRAQRIRERAVEAGLVRHGLRIA
jgi:hypothetical protein